MRILLSNDDGVYAPGLKALYEELSKIAEVIVVAPDRDRSAAGKSLTLNAPLRPRILDNGFCLVEGTPTDCVHLALTQWLKDLPDLVIAGINAGANLGDDVLYSGTVAAATEGHFFGLPAIATSLAMHKGDKNYESAARIIRELVEQTMARPLDKETMLNVNIPDLPYEEIKGYQVTHLGQRHRAEGMIEMQDPRGNTVFWIGPPGPEQKAGPGTDFYAINEGYVSITPLQMDLTKYNAISQMADWVGHVKLKAV